MTKRSSIKTTREEKQTDLFGGAPPTPKTRKTARAGHASLAKPTNTSAHPRASPGVSGALLNVRQAAARLGLSKSTVDKMRGAGKGPRFIKSTDRAIRYDPKDLDAWIEARRSHDA